MSFWHCRPSIFMSSSIRGLACSMALSALHLPPGALAAEPSLVPLWKLKLKEKPLVFLDADVYSSDPFEPWVAARVAFNYPSQSPSPFQVSHAPSGVLLVVVEDDSPCLQLLALDLLSGERLWQVPCTSLVRKSLPSRDFLLSRIRSTFIVGRHQVVAMQRTASSTGAGGGKNRVVAYDIKSGAELWSHDPNQATILEIVVNSDDVYRDHKGWIDYVDKQTSPLATFLPVPAMGLLLTNDAGQRAAPNLALDIDTGRPVWRIPSVYPGPIPNMSMGQRKKSESLMAMVADRMNWSSLPRRQVISHFIRDADLFCGCSGFLAEVYQGTGRCVSLKKYSLKDGQMAWEYQDPSEDVLNWLVSDSVVLVHHPKMIRALDRSSGNRLYRVSDHRFPKLTRAFYGRTYVDGDLLFWFDRSDKKMLSALDCTSGRLLWEIPTTKDRLIDFAVGNSFVVFATEKKALVLDKTTGRELLPKPMELNGKVQSVAALDANHVVAVTERQVTKFATDPWERVFAVNIEKPKPSLFGNILLAGITAAVWSIPTSQPGPRPGSFTRIPYGLTPGGAQLLTPFLYGYSGSKTIQKMEQVTRQYTYLNTGNGIQRVNVETGKSILIRCDISEKTTTVMEKTRRVLIHMDGRKITASRLQPDDPGLEYSTALEDGLYRIRVGEKYEALDPSRAAKEYSLAGVELSKALTESDDPVDKCVIRLARGRSLDRIAVLSPQGADLSAREQARSEYEAVVATACNGPSGDLESLCREATRLLTDQSSAPPSVEQ
jgi:outer membrane protein assembly factor BamB